MPTDVLEKKPISSKEREDLGISEQKRECPECGEVFTLRGLYGHLRLTHGKAGKELVKSAQKAKGDAQTKADEIFNLLDQIKALAVRYREIEILEKAGCFKDKGIPKILGDSIKRQAENLAAELKVHGISVNNQCIEQILDIGTSLEEDSD